MGMNVRAKAAVASAAALAITGVSPEPAAASHSNGGHWNRVNTTLAQAYFIDHTPSAWPVNASTVEWNRNGRIGVYWRSAGSGCPGSNVGCVNVHQISEPGAGYLGVTYSPRDANGHFTSGVTVKLNAATTQSGWHRWVTCHELGHALGLAHRPAGGHPESSSSCMNRSTATKLPDLYDYQQLQWTYNH